MSCRWEGVHGSKTVCPRARRSERRRNRPAARGASAFIAVAARQTESALAPTHARPVLAATQEEALRAQVTTWWSARERRDHQVMYALMEPAYLYQAPALPFPAAARGTAPS